MYNWNAHLNPVLAGTETPLCEGSANWSFSGAWAQGCWKVISSGGHLKCWFTSLNDETPNKIGYDLYRTKDKLLGNEVVRSGEACCFHYFSFLFLSVDSGMCWCDPAPASPSTPPWGLWPWLQCRTRVDLDLFTSVRFRDDKNLLERCSATQTYRSEMVTWWLQRFGFAHVHRPRVTSSSACFEDSVTSLWIVACFQMHRLKLPILPKGKRKPVRRLGTHEPIWTYNVSPVNWSCCQTFAILWSVFLSGRNFGWWSEVRPQTGKVHSLHRVPQKKHKIFLTSKCNAWIWCSRFTLKMAQVANFEAKKHPCRCIDCIDIRIGCTGACMHIYIGVCKENIHVIYLYWLISTWFESMPHCLHVRFPYLRPSYSASLNAQLAGKVGDVWWGFNLGWMYRAYDATGFSRCISLLGIRYDWNPYHPTIWTNKSLSGFHATHRSKAARWSLQQPPP